MRNPDCIKLIDDTATSSSTSSNSEYVVPASIPKMSRNKYMSTLRSAYSNSKQCFYATVTIDSGLCRLNVTRVLFDTGAGATFLSRRAVAQAGLHARPTEPKRFTLADGSIIIHDEVVRFELTIAGVTNYVEAYVDDSATSNIMLLGIKVMDQFLVVMQAAMGRQRQWKVTVSPDLTGRRREKHIVQLDGPGRAAMIRIAVPSRQDLAVPRPLRQESDLIVDDPPPPRQGPVQIRRRPVPRPREPVRTVFIPGSSHQVPIVIAGTPSPLHRAPAPSTPLAPPTQKPANSGISRQRHGRSKWDWMRPMRGASMDSGFDEGEDSPSGHPIAHAAFEDF